MVMLVWWLTDRLRPLVALLAVAGIAGSVVETYAQQQQDPPPRRQQQQKPAAKPAQKPPAATDKTTPTTKKPSIASRTEGLPPSQVGIGTLAQFAFMVDPQTSTVLLFKDADKPMHPSSMAKMMTIYIVFEELASGRIKPDTKFRVSERAWRIQGSKMFVELGSEISVDELLKGMIVLSGNDACVVIAEGLAGTEEAFTDRMNKRARELGTNGTVFKNS